MTTRAALTPPTLETDRLRLRPVTDADAADLFALMSDADVLRFWDSPPWADPDRASTFIARTHELAAEGSAIRLVIEGRDDHTFVGWITLCDWNPDYRSARLGYCLTRASWGHGYASEVVRAVLTWAYDTLDLNRVQAEVDTRNPASARVLEKNGFLREGTLRQDCVVGGVTSDSWVYGLIGSDWLAT